MAKSFYAFDAEGARRVKKTVLRVEAMPHAGGQTRAGRGVLPGASFVTYMLIAKADMTADDTEYSCKYLEADGTEGDALNCRRPNGVRIETGDTGFLAQDSSGQNVFMPAHQGPENAGSVVTIGSAAEGNEAAEGTTWDVDTDRTKGLDLYMLSRVAYYDCGDEILYVYIRRITVDQFGHIVAISSETRVSIDVPTAG